MELFLIIVLAVFILLFLMVALKMLWMYEQPEDDWRCGTVFPKFTFMLSITVAFMMALVLPLDVENTRQTGEGLPDMWSAMYIIALCFAVFVIPLASFVYEASDDIALGGGSRIRFLLMRLFVLIVFVVLVVGLLYGFANSTTIPVTEYNCVNYAYDAPQTSTPTTSALCGTTTTAYLNMQMTLGDYIVALTSFVGWLLLVVFGSVGLSALPMDLIYSYVDRPTKADLQRYNAQKQAIGEQSKLLVKHGKELQDRERELRMKTGFRNSRERVVLQRDFNKFRQSVYLVEMEYQKIEIALKNHGENPVIAMMKLIGGFVGFAFFIVWILHCLLYICLRCLSSSNQPVTPFLDYILSALGEGDGYIAAFFIFIAIALYLLATVVKGAFKYGMKLFCLPIFPLREHDTPLNSLLFNAMLIVLSSGAIAHLMFLAFQGYAYAASATFLFNTQISHLDIFRWFFDNNVVVWIYVGLSLISCCFVVFLGRDEPSIKLEKKMNELMEKKGFSESDRKKAVKSSAIKTSLYDKKGQIKI
jgi:LMBR1 domain-containing protein 1